jgi:hypothetical protein
MSWKTLSNPFKHHAKSSRRLDTSQQTGPQHTLCTEGGKFANLNLHGLCTVVEAWPNKFMVHP